MSIETHGCTICQKPQLLYRHLQHHNDTIINRRRKTSLTKYLPLTLLQVFQKVTQGLGVRGSWRPNRNFNILTPTLMAVNVVSFSFSWCSTGGPGVHSAGCWLSLLNLISIFSGPQFIRAPSPFGLVWLSLPHLLSNWNSNSTVLTSVLTELYNSSTPTRSPTQSLKSHV